MASPPDPSTIQPPIITIPTSRLILRTLTLDDVDAFIPILTHPETMLMTTSGVLTGGRDEALAWLRPRALGPDIFKFVMLKDGVLVGMVGSRRWPEVGYLVHPDHAGKGYATEALRAFLPAALERFPKGSVEGDEFVTARTDVENLGSQAVLRKVGFERVRVEERSFQNVKLGWRDSAIWKLERGRVGGGEW